MNLDAGPNAMLLHPPAVKITPEQFLCLGEHSDVLTRMARLVRPVGRGIQAIDWMGEEGAVVFDHDIYTIVLGADATAIPAALQRVPANRRPVIHDDLFSFYATVFPLHTIAWGRPIEYAPGTRHSLRAFLTDRVIGRVYRGDTANGDFAITHEDLLTGRTDRIGLQRA